MQSGRAPEDGKAETMESITVRKAGLPDAETIARFNAAMALETENKVLEPEIILAGVRGLMTSPEYGFYLVAEAGSETAACLLLTYEWSDWRNGLFWWVQSVYVHPGHRRRGIYRQMYGKVRELARLDSRVRGIRLYVERENRTARTAYENLGMTETGYRMYEEELAR